MTSVRSVRDGGGPADEPVPMDEPTTTQDPPLGDPPTEDPPEASRRAGTTYDRVVVALLCLVGVQIGQRPLNDNSFFTHLATGRIILDGGGIPRSDPYTFSAHGASWTVQSWLASVLYAGAEEVGGLTAVRFENGLIAALVALLESSTADRATRAASHR